MTEKKKVLHVGCGAPNPKKLHRSFRTPDWQEIRVDIDPKVKPDIIADMTNLSVLKDLEVHAVWSSHNVEHLPAHRVGVALKEFFRVLKPGGFVLLTLPDLQAVAAEISRGRLETPLYTAPGGPISALDIVYGFGASIARGNHFMAHRTGFTAETLGRKLKEAGFTSVQVKRDKYDPWASGYKLPPGHPKRSDKIAIIDPSRPGGLPDALDVPPKAWKPLGLKDGKKPAKRK
jgi:SAM-dependent methyltransferase